MALQTAVQSAAAKVGDGVHQTAQNVVQRQQRLPAKGRHDGFLGEIGKIYGINIAISTFLTDLVIHYAIFSFMTNPICSLTGVNFGWLFSNPAMAGLQRQRLKHRRFFDTEC